jgi:hypothetical protein
LLITKNIKNKAAFTLPYFFMFIKSYLDLPTFCPLAKNLAIETLLHQRLLDLLHEAF